MKKSMNISKYDDGILNLHEQWPTIVELYYDKVCLSDAGTNRRQK